jgi:hypothetical protein
MSEQMSNNGAKAETLPERLERLAGWLLGVLIVVGGIFGLPVYLLWNHSLVGAVEGVNEISFFQAWGITVLCIILFRGPDRANQLPRDSGKSTS